MFEHAPEVLGNLPREIGWNGIADLCVLVGATTVEEVVVYLLRPPWRRIWRGAP